MYTIDPGDFKHPIELQQLEVVKINNIASKKWVSILKTKAKIINISGKEVQETIKETSSVTKRFIIRYPKYIDDEDSKKYKLIYKDKEYNITYLSNIKDLGKYLEIVTERNL